MLLSGCWILKGCEASGSRKYQIHNTSSLHSARLHFWIPPVSQITLAELINLNFPPERTFWGRPCAGTASRRVRRRTACSRCACACAWSGWTTGWTPSRTPRTCAASHLQARKSPLFNLPPKTVAVSSDKISYQENPTQNPTKVNFGKGNCIN